MSKYRIVTPWWCKGETGEYLRDWADFLLHSGHGQDWTGLARKARRAGLDDQEINEFLNQEKEAMA